MGVDASANQRLTLSIGGAVQGVGFRPFVYRLATELGLGGWVSNAPQGVLVEVEGDRIALEAFLRRIEAEQPPRASIGAIETMWRAPAGYREFTVRASAAAGAKSALVLPDIAACDDCLREVADPSNRRYRYPFTNCTNCGPRYSIVEALPYDRANTSMRRFTMCAECQAEYNDPRDRRFHAQPNACPRCGPQLALWRPLEGDLGRRSVLAVGDEALRTAAQAIRDGAIVAVKGLGGFHLLADARSPEAVARLRRRKGRQEKPFALMYPSLAMVRAHCDVGPLEEQLLCSPAAPIVLLRRVASSSDCGVAPEVAPGNPYLGVMLPYTPLHQLLLAEGGFPVVATSGNRAEEPICTDEYEALGRLRGIADLLLVHDRPIVCPVDDAVARVVLDAEQVLRRARGYAPLPIHLPHLEHAPPMLGVGAQLKNAVALAVGDDAFLSQHIGDMEAPEALAAFERTIRRLSDLYEVQPALLACDAHPDYGSTRYAEGRAQAEGLPLLHVQHHEAHVLGCLAEHGVEGPALGVAWDGTGYGPDGTAWGGEFLHVTAAGLERVAHLRTFGLPGGEQAIREPRRAAFGLLVELFGDALDHAPGLPELALSARERTIWATMLRCGLNAPRTSSAGRLFDALAALLGLCRHATYEGQAAQLLEWAIDETEAGAYPFALRGEGPIVVDWAPIVGAALDDLRAGVACGRIAARFHNTLAEIVVAVARRVGEERVALTGGCFQNRVLTERAASRLRAAGFHPIWHRQVPPNDGGVALGQIVAARRQLAAEVAS